MTCLDKPGCAWTRRKLTLLADDDHRRNPHWTPCSTLTSGAGFYLALPSVVGRRSEDAISAPSAIPRHEFNGGTDDRSPAAVPSSTTPFSSIPCLGTTRGWLLRAMELGTTRTRSWRSCCAIDSVAPNGAKCRWHGPRQDQNNERGKYTESSSPASSHLHGTAPNSFATSRRQASPLDG